jgi:hypothetical protein
MFYMQYDLRTVNIFLNSSHRRSKIVKCNKTLVKLFEEVNSYIEKGLRSAAGLCMMLLMPLIVLKSSRIKLYHQQSSL